MTQQNRKTKSTSIDSMIARNTRDFPHPGRFRISGLREITSLSSPDTRACATGETENAEEGRLSFPQAELSNYADTWSARGRRSSETSNVSKFERTVQYISTDGKADSFFDCTAKSETPLAISVAPTPSSAVSWGAHDTAMVSTSTE